MKKGFMTLVMGATVFTLASHPIDFAKIQHWTGTGPNSAALVVQFNLPEYGTDSYVWGYRWENDEEPNGETMFKAICANSARLSLLSQKTGSMGSTVNGVGYSLNQEVLDHVYFDFDKALNFDFINFDYYNSSSFMGQTSAPGDAAPEIAQAAIEAAKRGNHVIEHPFNYDVYHYPAYDYDCWLLDKELTQRADPGQYGPKWKAAWYEGYWSYWTANKPSQDWMYSGTGYTGRSLVNGSVDGWSYTQFESAMVGGMGEGVAPCEDGAIWYMPALLGNTPVDFTKAVRDLGTGVNTLPMVIHFGGNVPTENIVLRLHFGDKLPEASEVLTLLNADPAFSVYKNRLIFDANGDGKFVTTGADSVGDGEWTLTEYEDCVLFTFTDDQINTAALNYLPERVYVNDLRIKGVEGNVITLNPKRMIGILCDVYPENADIKDFDVTLTGNGTDRNNMTASMYKVNYWDENNTRVQFYELSGHRVGECQLTISAKDGSGASHTYTVRVEEQDRTPLENGYLDGTIILNEEWFGHTNGGLNYITPEGEMMYQVYERENPGMSFGATSQYATIWADRLIAISKQAVDGGDPLPGGGRVVIADAKTLKRQGSIDDLMFGDDKKSADGRAVAGATPDKAYVGSSNGVYIIDLNDAKVIGKVAGISNSDSAADLYSGQIGDMVHAGRYVFGILQGVGAFAIDVETDEVVRKYPFTTVQGITQSADGNVWIASTVSGCGRFTCVDLETLEIDEESSVTLPAEVGYPVCSWGAWRSTPFTGCQSRNVLWFNTGGGIAGGSSKDRFYGWEIGSDPTELTAILALNEPYLKGSNSRVHQKTYGTLRFDDRSDELIVMTTEDSSSGHYRYNWTHFVDPETGAIKRTIDLEPYYWFQAFAIFPDKHEAEINLGDLTVDVREGEAEIDLADAVTDKDSNDANIRLSLLDVNMLAEPEALIANVSLDGKTLKVNPVSAGLKNVTLVAESNGRVSTKNLNIAVTDIASGIHEEDLYASSFSVEGRRLMVRGMAGRQINIYDNSGLNIFSFTPDTDNFVFDFGTHTGVFVVKSDNGETAKVMVK